MNIYAKHNDFVKYTGASDAQATWAGCTDPRPILKEGFIYAVDYTDVHSAHTKVHLKGVEGAFNSVCFVDAELSDFEVVDIED